MGGTKRKISMEKIEKKDSRSVAFSKRRNGLYSKISDLCLLSDAQIAVLATPISSKSNVSFYSFGHSSVDNVVSAFLSDQCPPRDDISHEGLGFWWEEESLAKSENLNELNDAVDSISRMLQNLKVLHSKKSVKNRRNPEDLKTKNNNNKEIVLHGTHQDLDHNQTLTLQSTSTNLSIQDDSPVNFEGFVENNEEDNQIVAISSNSNNFLLENLDSCDEEFDFDQFFDFVPNSQGTLMTLENGEAYL